MPLTNYKGNSSASSPLTSDNPYLVTLSGAIPGVFNVTPPVVVDTDSTVADADEISFRTLLADTSGGGFTITLPATPVDGEIINIKRVTTDGAALVIDPGAANFEGAGLAVTDENTDLVSYQLQYAEDDGSWWII